MSESRYKVLAYGVRLKARSFCKRNPMESVVRVPGNSSSDAITTSNSLLAAPPSFDLDANSPSVAASATSVELACGSTLLSWAAASRTSSNRFETKR